MINFIPNFLYSGISFEFFKNLDPITTSALSFSIGSTTPDMSLILCCPSASNVTSASLLYSLALLNMLLMAAP